MGHLLLVDNDTDILELLELGLTGAGFTVQTATSGLDALRLIERDIPDVLITDLIMPSIAGDKLLEIIHAVPQWKTIKTIVISGVAIEAPDLRDNVLCDAYIAKGPIASTLQHLINTVRNINTLSDEERSGTIGADGIFSRHITRELLESKQEVERVLDQITDGVCKIDQTHTIIWLNSAFATLVGTDEAALLGRTIESFLPTSLYPRLKKLLQEEHSEPIQYTSPKNRSFRVTLLSPSTDGTGGAILMARELEHDHSQSSLHRAVVADSPLPTLVADTQSVVTLINPAGERLLKRSARTTVGRTCDDLFCTEGDGSHSIHQTLTACTATTISRWLYNAGETPRPVKALLSPLKTDQQDGWLIILFESKRDTL